VRFRTTPANERVFTGLIPGCVTELTREGALRANEARLQLANEAFWRKTPAGGRKFSVFAENACRSPAQSAVLGRTRKRAGCKSGVFQENASLQAVESGSLPKIAVLHGEN
jgi:hypothetical protein